MGRSLAWFVVDSDLDLVAAALDVKRTGKSGAHHDLSLCARTLPDGRVLVLSRNCDEPLFKPGKLGAVTRLGRTFSGALEEHVMFSQFTAWGKGRKSWSARHQGEEDTLHLKATGRPPKDFTALRDAALERQRAEGPGAEVDHLFDLPQELARHYTGIDFDGEASPELAGDFEQLDIGFWRRLWQRTLWWRIALMFLGGGALFIFGMFQIIRVLEWLVRQVGLR
jgi:hypothetical protein